MVWPPRSAGQAGVLGHLIGEVLGPIEVVVGGGAASSGKVYRAFGMLGAAKKQPFVIVTVCNAPANFGSDRRVRPIQKKLSRPSPPAFSPPTHSPTPHTPAPHPVHTVDRLRRESAVPDTAALPRSGLATGHRQARPPGMGSIDQVHQALALFPGGHSSASLG